MAIFYLIKLALLCWVWYSTASDPPPVGHLQPLGSQTPPVGSVLLLNEVPSPQEFFSQFVKQGRPVLFRGAAVNTPAFKLWTDEYLRSKYGELVFDVEEGKKENRSKELYHMSMHEFVKKYQKNDVYMVASVPKIMRDDVYLLKCLLCGGFTDELQDTVMWFSSGGTKSVLHFDAIDNINCLISGTKDLFMVDKREHAHIHIDRPDGSFSNVDVDKVDLYKYPGLANVPWYQVHMEPGDCLFIPYRWFHQVRSYGSRNLAINIWFSHRYTFNESKCGKGSFEGQQFAPLSAFNVAGNVEPKLRVMVVEEMQEKPVNTSRWKEVWKNLLSGVISMNDERSELLTEIFRTIDANNDSLVSPEEVMSSSLEWQELRSLKLLSEDEINLLKSDGEDGDDGSDDGDGDSGYQSDGQDIEYVDRNENVADKDKNDHLEMSSQGDLTEHEDL